jgi:hypothetical protein
MSLCNSTGILGASSNLNAIVKIYLTDKKGCDYSYLHLGRIEKIPKPAKLQPRVPKLQPPAKMQCRHVYPKQDYPATLNALKKA